MKAFSAALGEQEQDKTMKEMLVLRSHLAEQSPKTKKFKAVAKKLIANSQLWDAVTRRKIAQRVETRMAAFIQMQIADEAASKVLYKYSLAKNLFDGKKSELVAEVELKYAQTNKQHLQQLKKKELEDVYLLAWRL